MCARMRHHMTESLYWIWLTQCPGLGATRLRQLLELAGSPETLWAAGEEELTRMGVPQALRGPLLDKRLDRARTILQACDRLGITVLTTAAPPSGWSVSTGCWIWICLSGRWGSPTLPAP